MALSLLHAADRVVLISLDGLGQKTWTQDSAARELTAFRNLSARGAVAEGGMLTAFPSTTANSHAALWTGAWGDVNGITFNSHPVGPRSEHTFLARGNGFRAEGLRAEPLWVTAARQGVRAVAHQVTQGYPFLPSNTWPENLTLLNGYQTRTISPHMVLRAADVRPGTAGVWREALPESKRRPSTSRGRRGL
jgi:predicted AlkP superfamily phosphohydrolase/phosphomutase